MNIPYESWQRIRAAVEAELDGRRGFKRIYWPHGMAELDSGGNGKVVVAFEKFKEPKSEGK